MQSLKDGVPNSVTNSETFWRVPKMMLQVVSFKWIQPSDVELGTKMKVIVRNIVKSKSKHNSQQQRKYFVPLKHQWVKDKEENHILENFAYT